MVSMLKAWLNNPHSAYLVRWNVTTCAMGEVSNMVEKVGAHVLTKQDRNTRLLYMRHSLMALHSPVSWAFRDAFSTRRQWMTANNEFRSMRKEVCMTCLRSYRLEKLNKSTKEYSSGQCWEAEIRTREAPNSKHLVIQPRHAVIRVSLLPVTESEAIYADPHHIKSPSLQVVN
jgi:hypothetical protein